MDSMTHITELETERLRLRQWQDSDYPVFADINADPEVMKYYPKTLTPAESDEMANKIKSLISQRGWGFWALEQKQDKKFIGFVGLHEPTYELPVSPCIEVGWRLSKAHWGKGLATEAGRAALKFAFETLRLSRVYSFASVQNQKSRSVMERLKMSNTHKNFEHPIIPTGNPLREHVLYKLTKQQWNHGVAN